MQNFFGRPTRRDCLAYTFAVGRCGSRTSSKHRNNHRCNHHCDLKPKIIFKFQPGPTHRTFALTSTMSRWRSTGRDSNP